MPHSLPQSGGGSAPPRRIGKVAFLGYGRFGAALGSLLGDAGIAVRALDPGAEIHGAARAGSLPELVDGADLVLVAVPVPAMREAFASLRPHLAPGQVVADVGSVKTVPARAMAEVLGEGQPWVATHPLFGPASLARGERPLRVVVCPNPAHPDAVRQVAALFERIGCQVLEQAPEEHDRVMAFTHALAFFIAKGMLDAGVPAGAPYAPPSFQGIAHTIETVRVDAGHLFAALHRENPFAGEARRRLINALLAVDRSLDIPTEDAAPEDLAALSIPDLGSLSPELRETRELIDELDLELVELLARRSELVQRAARAKATIGAAVRDPLREARLMESRRRRAAELGLDADGVAEVFEVILRHSRSLQERRSST
ncbi:prephenate dehydrogenase/arogenate dehydrogenase family protein [Sorangium sp. So ce394]|uniref:prephenate dehydrogenase/arogenate dehydrogenase family protein n=1 Tax=unclassified Sorangium TaxID=2621164 RepID=UPI003F5CAEA5